MNKLERKIISKVYKLETKRTVFQIASKIASGLLIAFLLWFSGSMLVQVLIEQKSFDFLNIFKENSEVIKKYLFDSLLTFYNETPKELLFLIIILSIVFIFIILTIIRNFAIIINKLKSIYKFYKR